MDDLIVAACLKTFAKMQLNSQVQVDFKVLKSSNGNICIGIHAELIQVSAGIKTQDPLTSKVGLSVRICDKRRFILSTDIHGIMCPMHVKPNSWILFYPDGFNIVDCLTFQSFFTTIKEFHHAST